MHANWCYCQAVAAMLTARKIAQFLHRTELLGHPLRVLLSFTVPTPSLMLETISSRLKFVALIAPNF